MSQKLQLGKKHKRGKRTFIFIFIHKAWWLVLISLGFFYLSWATYWGNLNQPATNFLLQHSDWYITTGMLSEWAAFLGFSILLIGYLRANVHYRMYKFILDEYAVHLRRGLFYIRETTIPYHQITNVHIGRPYHYRMLGLAQLDIVTAADRGDGAGNEATKEFLMPTIDVSLARILSRQLLESSARSRNKVTISDDDEDEDEDFEEDENEENLGE